MGTGTETIKKPEYPKEKYTKDEFFQLLLADFMIWSSNREKSFDGWNLSLEDWAKQMRKYYHQESGNNLLEELPHCKPVNL